MGLFKRTPRGEPGGRDPVEAFWSWWRDSGAAATAAALADREPVRIADELGRRVDAIGIGLAWELSAGTESEHVLVVSPEGNPDLRAAARRWLRAAPPRTPTWAYADSRRPVTDLDAVELEVDGRVIAFRDVVMSARREGLRISVSVHHPSFQHLDDESRATIAYLALDSALGETDVECWIGEVSRPQVAPLDAFPLVWIRSLVADLKSDHTSPDGEPQYVMFRGAGSEGPILAVAQVPLAAATAPDLDTHCAVFLAYLPDDSGLPNPGSLDALRRFEEGLAVDLGGCGRVVAHQSHAGTRVLHVYVDGTTDAAEQVREHARRWTEGTASVTVTRDPAWDMVSHLRG